VRNFNTTLIAATAALIGLVVPASAEADKAFFDGKTVNYVVATEPGGNYDTYGRLVAQYMQKHLPGSTFIVRNMPGAGHMIGTNFIYASEPDGLTIGTFNTGLIYRQLSEDSGVRFDLSKMSWVGKAASDPRVIVMSEQSGVESLEQLIALKEPVKFATSGVGSASYMESQMLIDVLNLPVELVSGYNGNDDSLAMMRGEVMGIVASRSAYTQFVNEGKGRYVAQIGGTHDDVPQLSDLVSNEDVDRVVALIASQGNVSRLTAGPEGIPAERLEALREAYQAAVTDPEFIERANAANLPLDPVAGDAVGEAVVKALAQDAEVIDFLKRMAASN
jgi:tripartite-type tricarboxylate transporter receptor subunit TctC